MLSPFFIVIFFQQAIAVSKKILFLPRISIDKKVAICPNRIHPL